MDENYLDKSSVSKAYRLETYRSAGSVSALSKQQLRCYFLAKCNFVQPIPEAGTPEYSDVTRVGDKTFLSKASSNTLEIYQAVMDEVLRRHGPVIGACPAPTALRALLTLINRDVRGRGQPRAPRRHRLPHGHDAQLLQRALGPLPLLRPLLVAQVRRAVQQRRHCHHAVPQPDARVQEPAD